ncbi:MAG TPA: amidohydrolase family protein [Acidimicrobiales bacterium]|nr:amidohydrolase family protein [Acidimicrobiales bacterium]
MPYIEGRVAHDADSHVMEPAGWYEPFMPAAVKERLAKLSGPRNERFGAWMDKVVARHDDPDYRKDALNEVMLRKGWEAHGAFRKDDRPEALDALGFASQLVFTTALLGPLGASERADDPDFAYGLAEGHNRAILDFCAADERLLPVGYLPMVDVERTAAFAKQAIEDGCAALMMTSRCPKNFSPSHIALDATWAQLAEAGVPPVFHVGGGDFMDPTYKKNGLPPVKDFVGGDTNFTSVSFLPIANAPMQSLGTMIMDGVFERFPDLRFGVIEQGAGWVPSWMRMMDSAADAFGKEERLQKLSLKPSEYVRRQIRATPYPHEDIGWIIRNAGPEICMFNSDFPHTEGGRNPVKRFETSMDAHDCDAAERDAFYAANMVDLVGALR